MSQVTTTAVSSRRTGTVARIRYTVESDLVPRGLTINGLTVVMIRPSRAVAQVTVGVAVVVVIAVALVIDIEIE